MTSPRTVRYPIVAGGVVHHAVTGEITDVDRNSGRVDMRASDGSKVPVEETMANDQPALVALKGNAAQRRSNRVEFMSRPLSIHLEDMSWAKEWLA
jgi:hypothetical protein